MKERIIEFLRSENKSSAQLAEEIGVQPSGISHILSGRNKPSLDFILKMLEKYPFLSTEWLLFGKGKMYNDQTIPELFTEQSFKSDNKDRVEIPKKSVYREHEEYAERQIPGTKVKPEVEKIVWFFMDKTFREYFPGTQQDET